MALVDLYMSASVHCYVRDFQCFRRDSPGHWTCITPTRFMDLDIADLLDQQHEKNRQR